jgi:hypothetical protein
VEVLNFGALGYCLFLIPKKKTLLPPPPLIYVIFRSLLRFCEALPGVGFLGDCLKGLVFNAFPAWRIFVWTQGSARIRRFGEIT